MHRPKSLKTNVKELNKMRWRLILYSLLTVLSLLGMPESLLARTKYDTVYTARELEAIFSNPVDSLVIYLAPGDYHLRPKYDQDNSVESWAGVPVPTRYSYGLRITGKFVSLRGPKAHGATIYTHAGYGIFFDNCINASIEGLIISGGIRDPDSMATNAAIVIRNSRVKIVDNIIFENLGADTTVARTRQGIMGICGREGSYSFIFNNQIARNSGHGIAMYKDSRATITGNLIDGVDEGRDESKIRGGQGIGIFLTRNAKASVETNVIKRYRSGIAVWVNADAIIAENLVENIKTWGISLFDGDTGRPRAAIEKNVIYKTGGCGISIVRFLEGGNSGYCRNNIMVETAQDRRFDAPDRFCYQCALAVIGRPDNFAIEGNVFYKNFWLAPCYRDMDIGIPEFAEQLQNRFSSLSLQWYAGYSEFIQRFYLYVGKRAQ